MKLDEYGLALVGGNADSGIIDIDAQLGAAAPAPDQHAASQCVLDGVGNEILQQPPQQAPIGPDAERTRHENQVKALAAGKRSEVGLKPEKKLVDSEAHDLGLHRAGVEPGDFEQRRKDVFDGLKRCVDIGDERRFAESLACSTYRGGKGEALHEARHVEPGGVQRLKNVMARGGEEFRLRQVGGFSGRLCLGEFRIEMLKLD